MVSSCLEGLPEAFCDPTAFLAPPLRNHPQNAHRPVSAMGLTTSPFSALPVGGETVLEGERESREGFLEEVAGMGLAV